MIEYESFIYLDVYRTGSTHLISLLERITEEKLIRKYRHASLTKGRRHGLAGGKLVFATVRNPWDWYVSLWAYGAGGKSAIRNYLTANLDSKELEELYDRSDPAVAFRRWLTLMHEPSFLDRIMGEHLPQSGLAAVCGLYTYRFMRVTTRFPRFLLHRPLVQAVGGPRRYHGMMRTYDTVLRNEHLSGELIALVEQNRRRCRFRADAADIIRSAEARPRNSSNRSLASYRDYYDERCAALVAGRDRFFIDEFGYRFE